MKQILNFDQAVSKSEHFKFTDWLLNFQQLIYKLLPILKHNFLSGIYKSRQ